MQGSTPLFANRQTCDLLIADAERAAAAADWPLCSSIVARVTDALRRRICGEESVLFPALMRMVSATKLPVQHMRGEHIRLGMLLDRLVSALAEQNGETFLACCENLLPVLRRHIAREERVLYAIAEQVVMQPIAADRGMPS